MPDRTRVFCFICGDPILGDLEDFVSLWVANRYREMDANLIVTDKCPSCLEEMKTKIAMIGIREDSSPEMLKLHLAARTSLMWWIEEEMLASEPYAGRHESLKQWLSDAIKNRWAYVTPEIAEKINSRW